MFKVPDWEEDTPKIKMTFAKKIHSKKNVKPIEANNNENATAQKNNIKNFNANTVQFKPNKIKRNVPLKPNKVSKTEQNNVKLKITKGFATNMKREQFKPNTVQFKTNKLKKNVQLKHNNVKSQIKITNSLTMNTMKAQKRKHVTNISNTKKKKEELKNGIETQNLDSGKGDETFVNTKNKSKKHKLKNNISNTKKIKEELDNGIETQNLDLDTANEMLLNTKKKTKKHKLDTHVSNTRKIKEELDTEIENFDLDKPDKMLVNAKKKKLDDKYKSEDKEILFSYKKEKIRKLLEKNRRPIAVSGNKLRERMLERLKAAQFRYLNEKLYTSSGTEAQQLFQSDPAAFHTYHQGYQQQLKKWPVNPLDVIVKRILKMPKTHVIADMGCGEAALAQRVPHTVRSFDLVASSPGVEVCDMAHTPLLAGSVDAAVYCLALMGTELTQYLVEANRILKMGGHLLIAEVESRFDDADAFARDVERLGFKLKALDKSHKVFFFLQFAKVRDPPKKGKPALSLKPCLYKKR